MRNSIFLRTLLERWRSTLIWSIAMFGFAQMFAGLFESFSAEIEQIAANYPESLQAFVGDVSQAATPAGWLGVELYGLFVPMVLAIIAVGFGASAIGKEEESGTLELLLASPISRAKILLQKALAIEVQLAIIAGSVWLGVALGTLFYPFEVSLVDTFWATFAGWLLGVFVAYATFAVQAVSGRRGLALGFGAGLVALTYFADALSKLIDWLEFAKYLSPFYYYSGGDVLLNGANVTNLLILFLASVVCYVIAHVAFVRRDTGV